jgi:hypothetical protein
MAYDEWEINGLTPSWIIDIDPQPTKATTQFTIKCRAHHELLDGADPRTEISLFEDMISQTVNNDSLINGGTKLMVGNGDYITLTDGVTTWERAAVVDVKYNPDLMSTKWMDYDIIIEAELPGGAGVIIYTPPYDAYPNIDYYFYYQPGPPEVFEQESGALQGTEIGFMEITEDISVDSVEVYGCGCELPATLNVNGEVQSWHYGEILGTPYAEGAERLIFDDFTASDVITMKTSDHAPPPAYLPNHGAWLQWVKLTLTE